MHLLAINSGSSSLKFGYAELDRTGAGCRMLLGGAVVGIGRQAQLKLRPASPDIASDRTIADHGAAAQWVLDLLASKPIDAVGHRLVHGGSWFQESVKIDGAVFARLEALSELAPLHHLPALMSIRAVQERFGDRVPLAAVFDTGFHRDMPERAATYALPLQLREKHALRRYGFHGLAHGSMARHYAEFLGIGLEQVRVVTLQLGHGCSAAAIAGGRSIDTSMGFTPLEGLVMGTRCGDIDAAVVGYLAAKENQDVSDVLRLLNEESGLLGLSGLSSDMSVLLSAAEQGHVRSRSAIDLFCYRVKKYLGAYFSVLGGAKAVVFGGGIGERAPAVRAAICEGMEWCGLRLDDERNRTAKNPSPGETLPIMRADSPMGVYVTGVDEEREIVLETARCLGALPSH